MEEREGKKAGEENNKRGGKPPKNKEIKEEGRKEEITV